VHRKGTKAPQEGLWWTLGSSFKPPDRAFASYLVRHVNVATPRIACLRLRKHSVAPHLLPCETRLGMKAAGREARRHTTALSLGSGSEIAADCD